MDSKNYSTEFINVLKSIELTLGIDYESFQIVDLEWLIE